MAEKILIVDDEREIADLVELYLQNEGYEIYKFYNGREALECIEEMVLDLAILDIMLPDIGGLELCQKIREQGTYPVIMLSAKDGETDKITGLTLGADDYITKPFRPLEVVARVKAQLRRFKKYNTPSQNIESQEIISGGIKLNSKTHQCTLNEKPLSLTPTEFQILEILLNRRGEVVSSEKLFKEIWKDEYYTKNSNTITVHIRHLREKMGETSSPRIIKTVWGVGYKIEE